MNQIKSTILGLSLVNAVAFSSAAMAVDVTVALNSSQATAQGESNLPYKYTVELHPAFSTSVNVQTRTSYTCSINFYDASCAIPNVAYGKYNASVVLHFNTHRGIEGAVVARQEFRTELLGSTATLTLPTGDVTFTATQGGDVVLPKIKSTYLNATESGVFAEKNVVSGFGLTPGQSVTVPMLSGCYDVTNRRTTGHSSKTTNTPLCVGNGNATTVTIDSTTMESTVSYN